MWPFNRIPKQSLPIVLERLAGDGLKILLKNVPWFETILIHDRFKKDYRWLTNLVTNPYHCPKTISVVLEERNITPDVKLSKDWIVFFVNTRFGEPLITNGIQDEDDKLNLGQMAVNSNTIQPPEFIVSMRTDCECREPTFIIDLVDEDQWSEAMKESIGSIQAYKGSRLRDMIDTLNNIGIE